MLKVRARRDRGVSRLRFLFLTAMLLALNATGWIWVHHNLIAIRSPGLRVLSALPTANVDATDRLALVFDRPVATDSAIGRPLEETPFHISPTPEGHWRWAAADRLEYVLDQRLRPGRIYRVKPTAKLELLTGRKLMGQARFAFRTAPLRVLDGRIHSADRHHVNMELEFDQAVDPQALQSRLHVTDERTSRDLRPRVLPEAPGQTLLVRAERPESSRLSVLVEAGLAGHGAELGLTTDQRWVLDVSRQLALRRADVTPRSLAGDTTVRLWFTGALDREQKTSPVTLTPDVEGLRVSQSWRCLLLEGPFECNRRYTATVGETLLGEDGQTLGEPQTVTFEVPDREPGVRFPVDRGILSPRGNMAIDLEVVNITGLKLSCSRVHTNNLVAHLSGGWASETSRFLPERTFSLDLPRNAPATKTLDLLGLVGGEAGIYRITARATDCRWTRDSALVTVTDLAITSKQHREGCVVWVTSLQTSSPVAGAKVAALTHNNQTLASATTGVDGSALLCFHNDGPDGPVWVVTAENEGDLSYLLPETRSWTLDHTDTSGRKTPETYDVMLYGERGVYRPGETIHLTGIVRDASGAVPPGLPLSINVVRPDGRGVAQIPVQSHIGEQGMFHVDFKTDEDCQLGRYRFTATLPGGGEALGRLETLVEAFVPVRIEVQAKASQERYTIGMAPEVSVDARYLFGQPAAGLPVCVRGVWRPERFRSPAHGDFSFGPRAEGASVNVEPVTRELDASGRAILAVEPPSAPAQGLWRGRLSATVAEPGGRSVSANTSCVVDFVGRHIGLRGPANRIVRTRAPVTVDWIVLDGEGQPGRPEALEMSLQRIEWDWTIQRVNDRAVWKTTERLIPVRKCRAEPTGVRGAFEVRCEQAGRYRLQARDPNTGAVSEVEWYATDFGDIAEGVSTSRPGRVEIILNESSYRPGSTAQVLVRSPFIGTMFLTLETDRVVDRRVVEMAEKSVAIELPVPPDLRGGAFVTATVVRPAEPDREKWLPHRAMGIARLNTDHAASEIPLEIHAPSVARPGEDIRITVQAGESFDPARPARVHLWAVDEGILLTTAFRTPDPLRHFFGHRRLGVTTADVFGDLLPDHRRPAGMERIGADEDNELYCRTNPVPIRTRAPAIVWLSAVAADASGVAVFDIRVPNLTGELRLMAVAVDHDRYGSASRPMTVTAPLLVEASWPRFVAPGDRFEVPVKIFNTTSKDMTARPRLRVNGPLKIEDRDGNAGEIPLEAVRIIANSSATVWLHAEATGTGQVRARIRLEAESYSGRIRSADTLAKFTVRAFAPPHRRADLFRLAAGKSLRLERPGEFLPGIGKTTVRISARPRVQLRPAIQQLLDYPYGCVEQTASKLLGILHAPELISQDTPRDVTAQTADDMIAAGIVRLRSMQTRSGGLSYWPGGRRACLWGTAYAADFLVQARRNGHVVDREFASDLVRYLRRELSCAGDGVPDDNTRALICHVLAAFGEVETGWMNHLGERLDRLDIAGRAHLAGAWFEAGRRDRAAQVLAEDTVHLAVPRTRGGRVTSRTSQLAVLLQVFLDLCPDHPWVSVLVEQIEASRGDRGTWGTTPETAGCVAALARYQRLSKEMPDFTGTVSLSDGERLTFDHRSPVTVEAAGAEAASEIRTEGTGNVYVCITREGIAAGGTVERYDRGLRVRRTWKDISGRPIDPRTLRVGDLIHVEITCEAPDHLDPPVENVAIVDGLPGGMEAENPRLSTSAQDGSRQPDVNRMECLDDRVILFTTVQPGKSVFGYSLRAVSAGTFELPPIQASCMYDPEFASIHGGGQVEIAR